MNWSIKTISAASLVLAVSACGGGGGGSAGAPANGAPTAPSSFPVSGSAIGLEGSGLVLQNNGANDISVIGSGQFSFGVLPSGSTYDVTVKTQPLLPRQTCTVANGAGTVATAAVTTISVSCRTLVAKFLYVPNLLASNVSGYAIDAITGVLTEISGSPFPSGNLPVSLTSDPTERFLYTSEIGALPPSQSSQFLPNPTPPTVTGYSVTSATGALIEVPGSPFIITGSSTPFGSGHTPISFEPLGRFGYTTALISGSLDVYGVALNANNGSLTTVPSSPFSLASGPNPNLVVQGIFAGGNHFYVSVRSGGGGQIRTFDFDPDTGALMPNSVPAVPTGGNDPSGLSMHPSGKFVYVLDRVLGTLVGFALDASIGILTPIPGSPVVAGTAVVSVTIHPSGRFMFATSNDLVSGVSVAVFSIDQTSGVLSAVAGSPFVPSGQQSANDVVVGLVDGRGKFLYLNHSSSSIAAFAIDEGTGMLTSVPGSPFPTGARPSPPMPDPSGRFLRRQS